MNDIAHRVRLGRRLPLPAGVAVLYFLVARVSLDLDFANSNASPIWPPSGLALAAMLLWGMRVAPGIWLGAFLANAAAFHGVPDLPWPRFVLASAFIALGNLGEALLGAALIRRLRGHARLDSAIDVYSFAGVALLSALVSMAVGCGTLLALGLVKSDLAPVVAFTWWLGDATGMLVLTPLLLWLASPDEKRLGARALLRIGPTVLGFVLACALVFGWKSGWGSADRLASMLLVLSVMLAAYRHGLGGASLSVFGMSCVAVQQTLAGHGLFAKATVNDSLISLDGFILLCTMAGLVVAATAKGALRGSAAVGEANIRLPLAVLTGCLGLTLVAWHFIATDTERRARERFDQLADDVAQRVIDRMRNYELALEGGKGLFDASSSLSRDQWRAYVSALKLQQRVPGIQGMGFAQYIPASQLEAHERAMQAQGMPHYRVRPAGPRAEYTSIVYLEPFDERNQRAFSYDMLSEPVRHEAMARARASGRTVVSGRVTLLQETDEAAQFGFLMYVPVFKRGDDGHGSELASDGLAGFVYAPFRVGDLMRGVLRGDEMALAYLDLHDGLDPPSRQRMFSSYEGAYTPYTKQSSEVRTLQVGGRTWIIDVASTPAFEAGVDTQKAQISLVAGTLISLLVFSVMRALMLHRADALALAETMTRERAAVETRLQSLAETAGEAILVAVQGDGIDYCNGAAERMLGHARGELLGRPLEELVPEDQLEAFSAWLQEHGGDGLGAAAASRCQMKRKDGSTLPVEVNVSHWRANGVTYVGMVVRDITDHLAALGRLEQTKSLFSNVLDNIPAMVGLWDCELRNRYCNREYEEWFGVTASQIYGRHIRDVIGEELFSQIKDHIDRALSGERVSFERLIQSSDGRARYSQAHYLPDAHDGIVKGFFVLVFDITPLHTARQALQHNLRLHDLIFHHAGVGIALTRHHHHERVSREFTRLLGYEEGELDGQPSSRIFPDQASYEAMRRVADGVLPAGQPLDLEAFLRCKNGDTIWCRMLARAVDPQDEAQGTIWIVQDFRDRKQRHELLEHARADAESAARLKADFLANMSHEIRTPMNGIIGLTALTLESVLAPSQRENLLMVQDSARSLLGLLNDILDFSKIEAGKMTLEHAPFDLREQLWMAVGPSALMAWHKGVEFTVDVAPEVPQMLWGDSLRLMQVVRNLVDNAAKFTVQGEIICKVTHEAEAEGVRLMVEVLDTGPGIPDETKASIFEAFVQADSSVTREHGGTGLGLTICAQIISMMRGEIDLRSEPGKGACFSFTAHFDQASPPPELTAEEASALRGRCIGIAVRSNAASQALRRQLSAWGMRAIEPLKGDRGAEVCDAWVVDDEHEGLNAAGVQSKRIMLASPGGSIRDVEPSPHRLRKPVKATELARMLASLMSSDQPVQQVAQPDTSIQDRAETPLDLLLAEDHPVNQRLAQRLLEKRGHRVTLASNGAAAVELAHQHRFDLILMDVQMPVMDGLTATRAIRELEAGQGRHTPIIALTAHAMKDDLHEMMAQGFDAYLAKPFDPRELAELVTSVADRSRT